MKIQVLCLFLTATIISANFDYHEFTDSRGQCWRCYPNQPCEQCPRYGSANWPAGWSNLCFEPNCKSQENRKFLFPSRESDRYFRCKLDRNSWTLEVVDCSCGTLFNMKTQECVGVDRWSPYCSELITPIMITSCATGRRVSVLEFNGVQPENTTIWEPVTTTPMSTTTTIMSTTTTLATTTTPRSCACIPWWPCWCNPCWNMPCHNCNGCMG
ncbi:unnamed protein product [Chironomus riparius]|uniref:Uncharacterized protein n=1 Tax=Chironomus riparius TaxID=315576 RepID=A0A9N9S8U1_9DIPT|nr:unnamed protein product [Chironomus riparius]